MQRLLSIIFISAALVIAPASFANAQADHTDLTVASILTMAKELAGAKLSLKLQVASHIEHTGQEGIFETYMADVHSHARRVMRYDPRNQQLIDEAKTAFYGGEPGRAKELMRQCKWVRFENCGADLLAGRYGLPQEIVFQIRFINWELAAKDFEAAERRLKTTDWMRWRDMMVVRVANANIAAGRRPEGMEILRLLGRSESDLYSCILDNGRLGDAAILRKMACEGKGRDALDVALALDKISSRIHALGMIAEGLAGIPGSSFETLRQF